MQCFSLSLPDVDHEQAPPRNCPCCNAERSTSYEWVGYACGAMYVMAHPNNGGVVTFYPREPCAYPTLEAIEVVVKQMRDAVDADVA